MTQFSLGMQNQHKKDHGIQSPSTVFATDGMNMAARAAMGAQREHPWGVASVNGLSAAMQAAGQYLSNRI